MWSAEGAGGRKLNGKETHERGLGEGREVVRALFSLDLWSIQIAYGRNMIWLDRAYFGEGGQGMNYYNRVVV